MWKSSITYILLSLPPLSHGHGSMINPPPRQPESPYWYQVGCFIGCQCSGGGKEMYPQHETLGCPHPIEPTLPLDDDDDDVRSWNIASSSPRGDWNKYMPWRSPGSSIPIDSCGIASGFLPDAAVQYPHIFSSFRKNDTDGSTAIIRQGDYGTHLPPGPITTWKSNDVVTASFSLIVNHGGGYQYRVCPKRTPSSSDATNPTESCFSANPLPFTTDYHTVVHGTKTFTIPATDVTMGVTPEGSTWRRIPIPACNCDIGVGCIAAADDETTMGDDANDSRRSYGGDGGYGSCVTGLQFEAVHLVDGTWPGGYGYYVTRLFNDEMTSKSSSSSSSSPCMLHRNDTSCRADETHDCLWYAEKNICYETRRDDDNNDKKDGGDGLSETEQTKTKILMDDCSSRGDESSCIVAKTSRGDPCTWYEDANKKSCYDKESFEDSYYNQKRKKATTSDEYVASVDWHIVDHLRAPSVPGEYILQWRWDNEQTPQIWTTCADILVVERGDDEEEDSGGSAAMGRGGSLVMWVLWRVVGWMGLYALV